MHHEQHRIAPIEAAHADPLRGPVHLDRFEYLDALGRVETLQIGDAPHDAIAAHGKLDEMDTEALS